MKNQFLQPNQELKNLFIPYNLASLAMEKGFDEPCLCHYHNDNEDLSDTGFYLAEYFNAMGITTTQYRSNKGMGNVVAAPLYQQILDWLKTEHDIVIYPDYSSKWKSPNYIIKWHQGQCFKIMSRHINTSIKEALKIIR